MTCSITWLITCHYIQHHPITCSITWHLHAQLHDSLHTQLRTITCIAWHAISWAHDPVFPAPPSTAKESSSLSAGGAQDSRYRLRRLMRCLLERILLSCPKHENTGLESVRIMESNELVALKINVVGHILPAEKRIFSYKTNKQINDTGFQYLTSAGLQQNLEIETTILGSTN